MLQWAVRHTSNKWKASQQRDKTDEELNWNFKTEKKPTEIKIFLDEFYNKMNYGWFLLRFDRKQNSESNCPSIKKINKILKKRIIEIT